MRSSFTLERLDEVKITLKDYKAKIKKMLEIILNLDELKTSKVFSPKINKIRFDVSFCLDETIKTINRDYRQKDQPTDVITFSLFCDDPCALVYRKTADLGQIIVSLETADRQKKGSLEEEVMTLICHGVLHLLGFDHLTKKDYDFVVGTQKIVIGEL